jgi:hypothetical protein
MNLKVVVSLMTNCRHVKCHSMTSHNGHGLHRRGRSKPRKLGPVRGEHLGLCCCDAGTARGSCPVRSYSNFRAGRINRDDREALVGATGLGGIINGLSRFERINHRQGAALLAQSRHLVLYNQRGRTTGDREPWWEQGRWCNRPMTPTQSPEL